MDGRLFMFNFQIFLKQWDREIFVFLQFWSHPFYFCLGFSISCAIFPPWNWGTYSPLYRLELICIYHPLSRLWSFSLWHPLVYFQSIHSLKSSLFLIINLLGNLKLYSKSTPLHGWWQIWRLILITCYRKGDLTKAISQNGVSCLKLEV